MGNAFLFTNEWIERSAEVVDGIEHHRNTAGQAGRGRIFRFPELAISRTLLSIPYENIHTYTVQT
jgi:hypothetical protein